jgi:hypothetical protein
MSSTLKGQAWITGDKLIQDNILIDDNGKTSTSQVVLIDDIWDNLINGSLDYPINTNTGLSSTYQYFYWEYDMTDPIDDTKTVQMKLECPIPKEGLFTEPYGDPSLEKTTWATYWLTKYKTTATNAAEMDIQKTEYTLPGSKRLNFTTGAQETTADVKIVNNDIGDITNLLSMF